MSKKFVLKCISILLVFYILCPVFTSSSYAKSTDFTPSSPYSTKKQVVVSSDPRIEMISILQMMIGAWPMTDLDFDYLREVQETFFKFYNHPAVRMFGFMWYNYNFSQEIPSTFMLHLSDPPELKIQTPFTREIIERGGGERNLNDFLELLRDFAKETKFMDFYRDHLEFYQTIAERVEKKLGTKNTIGMLEDYFGFTNKSYELILVALFYEEGYGTHVDNKYFALLGPYDVDEKRGEKKPYWAGPDELHKQLLRRFSHAYINPFIFNDQKRVETTGKLFSPISLPMRYQRILNWKNCIIEHLVRSVSQSFTLWEYGKEEWEIQRLNDVHDSFVYIDYTSDWLNVYESNRDFYTDFEEFYPVIFDNFRKLCEFPLVPTQVSVENESENGVQLSWKDNTTEPGSLIILRKNSNNKYEIIHEQDNRDISIWTDRNVKIGDICWYKIAIRGDGGTIKSYAIKAIIPSYPPLSPENIAFTQNESTITFSFEYPYKAEGFTLFEFVDNEKKEIASVDISEEPNQEIILANVLEGDHVYYICSYITVQNRELETVKLFSTASNFVSVTIIP